MGHVRTALVLVGLQRRIVGTEGEPVGGEAGAEACGRLRDRFPTVVLVRHVRADGTDGGPEAAPSRLVPGCMPRPGDHLVTKHGLDAFEDTEPDDVLRRERVTGVVVAGLSTAHGVAATAATALRLGHGVVVAEDATASPDEAQHREALDRPTALGARTARVADPTATGE
ncbi:cysteine hydrolase family protein [Streptomyces caelestis]|uniref:cysteine hydrolase family protein n=1 Tax=Streptomyces caelestis TaxID=36816 RepID=UPI00364E8CFF